MTTAHRENISGNLAARDHFPFLCPCPLFHLGRPVLSYPLPGGHIRFQVDLVDLELESLCIVSNFLASKTQNLEENLNQGRKDETR